MSSDLNFSENDFPMLGSSGARSKSWKWNKTSSSRLISEEIDSNRSDQHPGNSETVPNYAQKKNYLYRGQRNEPSRGQYRTLDIEDLISKPEKLQTKIRARVTRHNRDFVLSGNPLDSDNPVRQRGFVNLYRKPKSLSKTKVTVLESRKELEVCKNFAAKISIEYDSVLAKSEVPEDYLWKSLYYGKNNDLRNAVCEASKSNQKFSASPTNRDGINEDSYGISVKKLFEKSHIPPHIMFIHHRNFKTYCDNCVTQELNETVSTLISQIVKYQSNKYDTNPTRAIANRRYVIGLKQLKKYVVLNKVKLFIIVPDMEDSLSKTVEELKSLAAAYSIPYCFALSRRKIGFLTCKKVGVSCFGILNYSGAEKNFDRTIAAMNKTKYAYKVKFTQAEKFFKDIFTSSLKTVPCVDDNLEKIIEKMENKFSFNAEEPVAEKISISKPVVDDGKENNV